MKVIASQSLNNSERNNGTWGNNGARAYSDINVANEGGGVPFPLLEDVNLVARIPTRAMVEDCC